MFNISKMKRLYYRIRSFIFLRKILKDPSKFKPNYGFESWVEIALRFYKKSRLGGYERDLLAAVIKKLRPKYPYQIKGWTKNQKDYEAYFKMDGHIDLEEDKDLEGKYVTMFRQDYYNRGAKEFDYYHGQVYAQVPIVFKVGKYYMWGGTNYKLGQNSLVNLNRQYVTAFRYSTPEEIQEYESRQKKIKAIEKQIKAKQKEINSLYKQKAKWS